MVAVIYFEEVCPVCGAAPLWQNGREYAAHVKNCEAIQMGLLLQEIVAEDEKDNAPACES